MASADKGTNSYATVVEADAYFENRLDSSAWVDATADEKARSLVTATTLLDTLQWTGVLADATQSLSFPRVGTYFDKRQGQWVALSSVDVPAGVVMATFELAYHLLSNDDVQSSSDRVESVSVGSINLSRITKAPVIPSSVLRFINPLLVNGGARSWWRAN